MKLGFRVYSRVEGRFVHECEDLLIPHKYVSATDYLVDTWTGTYDELGQKIYENDVTMYFMEKKPKTKTIPNRITCYNIVSYNENEAQWWLYYGPNHKIVKEDRKWDEQYHYNYFGPRGPVNRYSIEQMPSWAKKVQHLPYELQDKVQLGIWVAGNTHEGYTVKSINEGIPIPKKRNTGMRSKCGICGGKTDIYIETCGVKIAPCCMNKDGRKLMFNNSNEEDRWFKRRGNDVHTR